MPPIRKNWVILIVVHSLCESRNRWDPGVPPYGSFGDIQLGTTTCKHGVLLCLLRSLYTAWVSHLPYMHMDTRALHWASTPMPMPITTHAHGFWVGMATILLGMGGHGFDIIIYGMGSILLFMGEHGLKQSILKGVIE